MRSSEFKMNAAKSTPSARHPPSVLTPSPTLDKRAANKRRKCSKVKHDSDQLTLTQMYPLSPPDSDLSTTPTTTTTVPIMDSASLSFNAHKYKHLADARSIESSQDI